MANEINASGLDPASTYYAIVRDAAGLYVNGTTPEAYNAANWTSYAIGAAAPNSAGDWTGDFPAVDAGTYGVQLRKREGATPAVTDDLVAGPDEIDWSGSGEVEEPPSGDVTAFGARGGVEQKVGVDNLSSYADLNNNESAVEITAAIADDLTEAATDMHTAWSEYLWSIRAPGEALSTVALGSSNATETRWLADTNEYGAAVKAWAGRNIDAARTEDVPQQVATALAEWERRLEMIRTGKALLAYQVAEGVVDPEDDDEDAGTFQAVEMTWGPDDDCDEHARLY